MIAHHYPPINGGLYNWPPDIEKIRREDEKRKVESTTNDHPGKMDMDELENGKGHIFRQVTNFDFQRKLRGI